MWWYIGVPVILGVVVSAQFIRRRRQYAHWTDAVSGLIRKAEAGSPIDPALTAGVLASPMSIKAEARFLEGCLLLREGDPAKAATAFQRAYHGCPAYELAAVLVFTCMKMSRSDMPRLLPIFLETWSTMRRRNVPSSGRESRFLSLFDTRQESRPPPGAGAMAEILWRLPIPTLRDQIARAVEEGPQWAGPLLGPATTNSASMHPSAQTNTGQTNTGLS